MLKYHQTNDNIHSYKVASVLLHFEQTSSRLQLNIKPKPILKIENINETKQQICLGLWKYVITFMFLIEYLFLVIS